ncbi:MAG: PHP domain-containing protein [Candidatus Margulisbacteria bacterium]|nr:PHP domain-containing protein [Candidatus Margulisiibacteriota bacterium]
MPADLHIHTSFSDGTDSPEEIVELAKKNGLTTIAITDHDVTAGIEPAQKKGKELGIEVISGIELTTELPDTEVHILGYFIDQQHPRLIEVITRIQEGRKERIVKICEKLREQGIEILPEEVFDLAGHYCAGRPHVARALIKKGYIRTFKEAFIKYIGFKGPAYVPHYKLSPAEAIKLINEVGGLAVFGHPALSKCDHLIPDFVAAGLAGIEVFYSSHSESETKHYLELVKKYGLAATGGSDYHGSNGGRLSELGQIKLDDQWVKGLKDEHIRRNKS